MAAIELDLMDRIEITVAGPLGPDGAVAADNPLGKVPALVDDDGQPVFDSAVICAYLDDLAGGGKIIPASGAERFRVLTLEATADGMMDAGLLRMLESRRPEGERSPGWVEKQVKVCRKGLDVLDAQADRWGDACTIGQIAAFCALSYYEFRPLEADWRDTRPALADWYDTFSARKSAEATEPHD